MEQLKYYVYVYIYMDPESNKIFYVGKGDILLRVTLFENITSIPITLFGTKIKFAEVNFSAKIR